MPVGIIGQVRKGYYSLKIAPVSVKDLVWGMLHDQIHHRGQLSVYLRIVGGKVPSIYGPSADEPW